MDSLALLGLSHQYASAFDHRDTNRFGVLFHPDARLRVIRSGPEGDEIVSTYSGLAQLGPIPLMFQNKTFHFVGNHLYEIEGNRAVGEVYCQAHHLLPVANTVVDYVMLIRYADVYRRDGGGRWLFAERDVVAHWNETRAGVSF